MRVILNFSLVIILVVACSPKVKINSTKIQKAIDQTAFSTAYDTLYLNALSNHHYSYLFEPTFRSLKFSNNQLGTFVGGMKGLVLYSGLKRAILQHNKRNGLKHTEYEDFYSLNNFNQLLPEPLFTNRDSIAETFGFVEKDKQGFSNYNKKMVKHLHEHFIPKANDSINNYQYQTIYDVIFKRFGRNLTSAYIYLKKTGFRKETKAYKEKLDSIDFNCLEYLRNKYKMVEPAIEPTYSFTEMTPAIAIGFWLRRNMDGSRKEFWKGLSKIMYQYDRKWLIDNLN